MSKNQQVIKYLAISFAIFLIITIFTAIIKTGTECLGMKGFAREAGEVHSRFAQEMAESMNLKNSLNENDLIVKSFDDKEKALSEAKDIINSIQPKFCS